MTIMREPTDSEYAAAKRAVAKVALEDLEKKSKNPGWRYPARRAKGF